MANTGSNSDRDALFRAIQETPIIDHHAHPLLRSEAIGKFPLLGITTEAHEDLEASRTTLAHFRAVKQLSGPLGCEPTWEAVESAIGRKRAESLDQWTAQCLSGIQCLLVDDGLGNEEEMTPFDHFDVITPNACGRIVRIERIAERLIAEHCVAWLPSSSSERFTTFLSAFKAEIQEAISSPAVAGFKSVICYRTGLAVPSKPDSEVASVAFEKVLVNCSEKSEEQPFRLSEPGFNEHLVHLVAGLISEAPDSHKKPFQFHTGLGDSDIVLEKASPACLQPFIRAYPKVPFVLLHSGYPFVREMGYLASAEPNVYADVGEIFPVLSREGQESALRQVLEICPFSKLLWSSDGHFVPETYFLAVTQIREALRAVLSDYVSKGDLTSSQAVQLVRDLLFNNANKLYGLGLIMKTLKSENIPQVPAQGNLQLLSQYADGHGPPKFLDLWWNDSMCAGRMRAIPIRRVWSILGSGEDVSFGLATAYSGLMLNEGLVTGATPVGEHRLTPDFTTLRPGFRDGHALVMCTLREQDGLPAALCPRSVLQRVLDEAASHGLTFDLGFEVELLFVRRDGDKYTDCGFPGHNASNVRSFESTQLMEIVEEAIEKLDKAGIYVEMVHAECGPGAYEVILPRAPALAAVENLVYARDVISSCAARRGIRMTLHPKPFPLGAGIASHCHVSVSSEGGDSPWVYEPFYAGILKHLRAITAFTYSNMASYERAQDGCWAGGTWVTWGTQNREAPLRKIKGSHWEMKCLDGAANPYLALAAVLAAGTHGVRDRETLRWGDCAADPAKLSVRGREELEITERIPRSLEEALGALVKDEQMVAWMGGELVRRYSDVKRAEQEFLGGMEDGERRTWIMDRF